jgi:type VI secretion system protein ImpA
MFDVDQLIAPVSDESPSGDNLEYEPEFGELERAAQGKPAHEMGDEVIEAEGPDWRAVIEQGQELLGRSKDLRIAVLLARGAANVHGPTGLAGGAALIHGLLANMWDTVHPQLDEEDDNDPTFRVNSMLPLSDREGMLNDILMMPIVRSKVVGMFCLRDVRVANGDLQPLDPDAQVPDSGLISAAFQDCDLDELQADAAALDAALDDIGKCEAIFAEQIGAANSPDLDGLVTELKEIKKIYAENLAARGIGVEMPAEEGGAEASAGGGGGAPISGEVRSRDDAVMMIGKVITYYERAEPSSPVPVLLKRIQKLIPMDYMEIMQELTPDAVAQAEALAGIKHDDEY